MIGKVGVGEAFEGLIHYLFDEEKLPELLNAHRVNTSSKGDMINYFNSQRSLNYNVKKPVFHVAIAFDPSDNINSELMDEISKRYINDMGFDNTQYLSVRHYDAAHPHFHMVINRVDNDGKVISDSYSALKTMRLMQRYEKEYGFRIAGKSQPKEKDLVLSTIKGVLDNGGGFKDIENALATKGWSVKYNKSKTTGHVSGWAFVHDEKRIEIKASSLHRNLSYNKVKAHIEDGIKIKLPDRVKTYNESVPGISSIKGEKELATGKEPEIKTIADDIVSVTNSQKNDYMEEEDIEEVIRFKRKMKAKRKRDNEKGK